MEVGVQRRATVALPRERDPVLIVQEAGWVAGTVSTDVDNIDATEIRSTDLPARSQSLYWLSYPGTGQHILSLKEPLDLNIAFIEKYYI